MVERTTQDGRPATIIDRAKTGMSVFTMFGLLDGRPCHWTAEGRYRMDDADDPRDLAEAKEKTDG